MLKRIYSAVAGVALMNMLALVGFAGYAWQQGHVDVERIERVAAVLRGDVAAVATPTDPGDAVAVTADTGSSSEDNIRQAIRAAEVDRLKKDKMLADLQHQQVIIDRQMLRLTQDQERHQRAVAEYESQRQKREDQELSETFLQLVQSLGNMKPKNALAALMRRSDAEAARILTELSPRKRLGIVDNCKSREELEWRDRMFDAMLKTVAAQETPR